MEKSLPLKNEDDEGTESDRRVARAKTEWEFPHDIIIEILSRTPGTSLVRFRCVCKLWNSLIIDQRLINSHREHASRTNPPRIIIFSQTIENMHFKHHLTLIDNSWNIKYILTGLSDPIGNTPPCNGLICLTYRRKLKLCNPTTREFLSLPKTTRNSRGIVNEFSCSLGFHPLTKKYKVVRFFYIQVNHKIANFVLGCEVYTLGSSDSWRNIGNIHCYVSDSGINVNGSIYWPTGAAATKIPDKIIALDLKSEKFRDIGLPNFDGYDLKVNKRMFLVELEKNLCLVNANCACGLMDIWMLKGDDNLWIHRCRVSIKHQFDHRQRFEPLYIYEGKILLRWGGSLYYGDLQGKERAVQAYSDEPEGICAEFYAFVETLVPLRNA